MKTILKILGIAAGTYLLLDIGWIVGIINCDDYYHDRRISNNGSVEGAMELNDLLMKNGLKKDIRRMKRSEILSAHARKWAKEGYTSEEIKQGLDALRKKLY